MKIKVIILRLHIQIQKILICKINKSKKLYFLFEVNNFIFKNLIDSKNVSIEQKIPCYLIIFYLNFEWI